MAKRRKPKRACRGLRGPKRVACEGRETITVPAHTRCASKLKKNRAASARNAIVCDFVERDERGRIVCVSAKPLRRALTARASSPSSGSSLPALPAGTQGLRGRARSRAGAPKCEVLSMPQGSITYYWMNCEYPNGEEDVVAEMYVERAKPTKNACPPGGSRRCAKAIVSLPNIRTVDSIDTHGENKRKGYGTKLYQAAARDACAAGEPLVSYHRLPQSESNHFWKKQFDKGRAVSVGEYRDSKTGEKKPIFALQCGRHEDLSGVKRKYKARKR